MVIGVRYGQGVLGSLLCGRDVLHSEDTPDKWNVCLQIGFAFGFKSRDVLVLFFSLGLGSRFLLLVKCINKMTGP